MQERLERNKRPKTPNAVIHAQIEDSKLECGHENEPLEKNIFKAGNRRRVVVRVTSFRRKLLDEDNLCAKFHIDGLRRACVIFDDNPEDTKIEICQEKVKTKEQEGTKIEIIKPNEMKL